MKKLISFVSLLALVSSTGAFAASSKSSKSKSASRSSGGLQPTEYTRTFAVGLGALVNNKSLGPNENYWLVSPELNLYYYMPVMKDFTFRPGARINYQFMQPSTNLPSAIVINEYNLQTTLEASLMWRKYFIMPVVSFGGGMIYRNTSVQSTGIISTSNSQISGNSYLGFIQGQVTALFNFHRGLIDAGPFVRYTYIFNDPRVGFYFGLESSFRIF